MTDIDLLAEPAPNRSALAAREFVRRLAPSQVLLTDVRRSARPDEFRAVAQWPRTRPSFDRCAPGTGRQDPLLVAETLRQLGIYLPLRCYGVAADSRVLIEELRFDLDLTAPGTNTKYKGMEIACVASVDCGVRGISADGAGRLRNVGLKVRLSAGGREFARADGVARILSPAAYRAVRNHRRPGMPETPDMPGMSGMPGSDDARSRPEPMDPGRSGAARPDDARLTDGRLADGRLADRQLTDAQSTSADGSRVGGLRSDETRLTPVDPGRVGVTSPRDVLVAVDARGAVRVAPADPHHPFFHDHPSDHLTGMVLIGAVQQTAALQANEPNLRLRSCTLRALRFTEPTPPATVEFGPAGRFEIRQLGTVTATGEAKFES